MTISEPYIRKKGDKFILERKVDAKTEYLKTLNIRELMRFYYGEEASRFYEEATKENKPKASPKEKRLDIDVDKLIEVPQTFAQHKLSEQDGKTPNEEKKHELTEEEKIKLAEMSYK